jgi:hypothetical protein
LLKWTVSGMYWFDNTADLGAIDIYTGATSGGAAIASRNFLAFGASAFYAQGLSYFAHEVTSAVGTVARRVVSYRALGTGGNFKFFADATRPAFFICEDVGPAGTRPSP